MLVIRGCSKSEAGAVNAFLRDEGISDAAEIEVLGSTDCYGFHYLYVFVRVNPSEYNFYEVRCEEIPDGYRYDGANIIKQRSRGIAEDFLGDKGYYFIVNTLAKSIVFKYENGSTKKITINEYPFIHVEDGVYSNGAYCFPDYEVRDADERVIADSSHWEWYF